MALTYFLVLPKPEAFHTDSSLAQGIVGYNQVPESDISAEEDTEEAENLDLESDSEGRKIFHDALTTRDKLELAKPLVVRFMLPLFFVYLAGEFRYEPITEALYLKAQT